MGLFDKVVQGGKAVGGTIARNGPAAVGLAVGAAGAAAVGSAFYKRPEVETNPKYNNYSLQFPSDLIDPSADRNFYMTLRFVQYERRSIFDAPFMKEQGGIRLPIPTNLVDSYSISYSEESPENPATGAAMESGIAGGNSVKQGGSVVDMAGSIAANVGKAAGIQAIQKIADGALGKGSVGQVLQLGGLATNPFLTVMFKSPTFKKHQFSWKMAPNNEQESNTINEIINTFRFNALPGMSPGQGGALLTYPNMCYINLSPNEEFLYKFKPCVVTEMSVNFASAGTPSFFRSNKPTEVTLNVSFMEIEYWLREDIQNNSLRKLGL
jgi:hypothetical protein